MFEKGSLFSCVVVVQYAFLNEGHVPCCCCCCCCCCCRRQGVLLQMLLVKVQCGYLNEVTLSLCILKL